MNISSGLSTAVVPSCPYGPWFFVLNSQLRFSYQIITPVFFVLCLSGNFLNLWTFSRQSKSDRAYHYQSYLTWAELADVLAFTALLVSFQWAKDGPDSQPWFRSSYAAMCFAAHAAVPLCNGVGVVGLLLSVSMVADRVFAFTRPLAYKVVRHHLHRRLALGASVTVGMASSLYNVRLYRVVSSNSSNSNGGDYALATDTAYVSSPLASALAHVCNGTRIVGLFILIVCNAILVRLYKRRLRQVTNSSSGFGGNNNERVRIRAAETRATERALFVLAISQSVFSGVATLTNIAFYSAAYSIPTFNSCEALVFGPLVNIVRMLCDTGDTLATVYANRLSRRWMQRAFWAAHVCIRGGGTGAIT